MTEPRGNGPMGPDDDLAALAGLDLALDELAAGRDLPAEGAGGEAAALATLAAELRAAVPAPPPGAAERGRAAFLATAAAGRPGGAAWRRRSLPLRLAALAAALVVLVALPAAARQAEPGTALWPVREVGQQVRDRLADDPVHRANLRLNTAEDYIAAGTGAAEERREDMADAAEERSRTPSRPSRTSPAQRSRPCGPGPSCSRPRSRRWSARRTPTTARGRVAGPSPATTTPGPVAASSDDDPGAAATRVAARRAAAPGRGPGRARAPRGPGRGRGRAVRVRR